MTVPRKAKRRPSKMVLRLYVAGTSDRSMRASMNARELLDEHVAGRYELEVAAGAEHERTRRTSEDAARLGATRSAGRAGSNGERR